MGVRDISRWLPEGMEPKTPMNLPDDLALGRHLSSVGMLRKKPMEDAPICRQQIGVETLTNFAQSAAFSIDFQMCLVLGLIYKSRESIDKPMHNSQLC